MSTPARPVGRPPGRRGLPIIGETVSFARNPPRFVAERFARYGPIFRSHILGSEMVFMVGPEALRFVLGTHRDHFLSGHGWPKGLRMLMGESLMMQNGDLHQTRRKQLAPAFYGPVLGRYIPAVTHVTARFLARWERLGTFAWYPEMKKLTFAVASELFLGGTTNEADEARLGALFHDYTLGMEGPRPIIRTRLRWTPFGRALAARDALLAHVASVVRERRERPTSDALSLLVRCELDDRELSEQTLFLLFAGHESTTALLTYFCLETAQRPDVLQRLRDEQESLGHAPATLADLDRLPYLDAVLLEIERLHPPFVGSFRYVAESFVYNGYAVEAGTRVFYAIAPSHDDAATYRDPARFDPERFLQRDAATLRRDYSLVGFGGGARTCIGIEVARLEAKIVASHLLRTHEWSALPEQRLEPVFLPSVRPRDGYRVRFKRREAQ